MPRRTALVGVVALVVLALGPSRASAQQAISLNLGGFVVRGESGRVAGDTIVANLAAPQPFGLAYQVSDFDGFTFGGDWLIPFGKYLEGSVGVSYYSHTVPSFYRDMVNDNGSEILQDLRLRIVPITATARFLPLGRRAAVQPYIGAGVAFMSWRYSETGEFVDGAQNIFRANFVDSGWSTGLVIVGGARIPVGHNFAFGGEIKYQSGSPTLDPNVGFVGDKIDLGGITYQATFILKF
jgi:outer membrane protein W